MTNEKIVLSIAKDFSKTPGGRFKREGIFSGEEFREDFLIKKYNEAITKKSKLVVLLDGCMGYPSSFLDESFGGLAKIFKTHNVLEYLEFVSQDQPGLIDDIKKYIKNNEK